MLLKGVKVTLEEDSAVIDLYITVEYGVKISEVAEKVQNNVRRTVETMTGLTVSAVNVFVQNVILLNQDRKMQKKTSNKHPLIKRVFFLCYFFFLLCQSFMI